MYFQSCSLLGFPSLSVETVSKCFRCHCWHDPIRAAQWSGLVPMIHRRSRQNLIHHLHLSVLYQAEFRWSLLAKILGTLIYCTIQSPNALRPQWSLAGNRWEYNVWCITEVACCEWFCCGRLRNTAACLHLLVCDLSFLHCPVSFVLVTGAGM